MSYHLAHHILVQQVYSDGVTALPVDEQFYMDVFANGTAAGMVHFEQDFLCDYNTNTNLTNSNLNVGTTRGMAAQLTHRAHCAWSGEQVEIG